MTPLPGALGGTALVAWRLDPAERAGSWDSGEGPVQNGGRWSVPGFRAVYASLDPATTVLELALNKGLDALRKEPHVLTGFSIDAVPSVHVVTPEAVPDQDWLTCDEPDDAQRRWGSNMLEAHRYLVIPSACSPRSWNVVFDPHRAEGTYAVVAQEPLRL